MLKMGQQQDVAPPQGAESVVTKTVASALPSYTVRSDILEKEENAPAKSIHEENAESKLDGGKHSEVDGDNLTSDFEFQDADMPLEVDSNECDPAFEDIPEHSTVSVNSPLYEPIQEYGRSYNRYRSGKYMLPNDEAEQARLELQHNLFLMAMHGELYLAPIRKDLHYVLDLATGTGIWAIDFAMKHPSTSVVGTDLNAIQPRSLPPNCSFKVADAEDDWLFAEPFDYIHGRMLVSCFRSFPAVVSRALSALRPGGYFELQDIYPMACLDSSWDNTALKRWSDLIVRGAAALGLDWMKAVKYKQYLQEAGFEDVREVQLAWATNTWPRGRHHKLLGTWSNKSYLDGLHGFTMRVLHKGLGMEVDEIEELLKGTRECLCDRGIHAYTPVRIVYGRKPLNIQGSV